MNLDFVSENIRNENKKWIRMLLCLEKYRFRNVFIAIPVQSYM